MLTLPLFTAAIQAGQESEDGPLAPASVTLKVENQAAGLQTQVAHLTEEAGEFEAIGKVLSLEPLLAARSNYAVARAELKTAAARLNQITQTLKRHEGLFRDGVSPKRSLQELSTQQLTEQAAVEAAQAKLSALANEIRLSWGPKLAEWIVSGKPDKLSGLASGRKVLLQITLSAGQDFRGASAPVWVEAYGRRGQAKTAFFISPATQSDQASLGESYFFLADNANFRAGMKVTAWVRAGGSSEQGVAIPKSALIWHMGQAFIYTKTGADEYSRREIKKFKPAGDDYLVQDGLREGDEVVSTGAQMLLSQELSRTILDED